MLGRSEAYERAVDIARRLLDEGATPTAATVASAAGISLSTYFRLVGSHADLLRAAGHVDEPTTRQRLLDAAAELLDEVGLSNLHMDSIAARAGVSRGTLYRIFPGKAELLAALAQDRAPLAPLGQVLAQVAHLPPEEVLPGLVAAAIPRLLAARSVLRAVLAEASVLAAEGQAGRALIGGIYAGISDYVSGQMEAGRLRKGDPLAAVQALLGPLLLYSVVRPDFWEETTDDVTSPENMAQELLQIWLRGMRP